METEKRCGDCEYFGRNENYEPVCKLSPPQLFVIQSRDEIRTAWPNVKSIDFCSHFIKKPVE